MNKQYETLDIGTFGKSRIYHKLAEYLSLKENQNHIGKVAKHLHDFSKTMNEVAQSNMGKGIKIHIITILTQEKLETIRKGFPEPFLNSHMQNAIITRKRDTLRKL